MTSEITISGRAIGPDHPPYIICELSGNHNGSLDRALSMIDAAAATGCDAIKLQTYEPDSLTIESDRPEFRISGGLWDGRTLYDLYKEAHTPFSWHEALFLRAHERGVTIFSTPFDEYGADLLADLGAPAYKIASFEAVDLALIAHVARKGKPMIISTGLSGLGDIERAVHTAHDNGCHEIVLLHCISSYPAPDEQSHLRTIPHLAQAFDTIVGLSDHTMGTAVSVAAVALGASVIEKHFTLARADGGPDSAFSLEPQEFRRLCLETRAAWTALGKVSYKTAPAEEASRAFRRSLYAVEDIAAGEELSATNMRSIRPGYGLAPHHRDQIIGRRARMSIARGTPLDWDLLA